MRWDGESFMRGYDLGGASLDGKPPLPSRCADYHLFIVHEL